MFKTINNWWQDRRIRYYRGRRWHLAIEIFLITVILLLAGVALFLSSYHPALNGIYFPGQTATTTEPDEHQLSFRVSAIPVETAVSFDSSLSWEVTLENIGEKQIDQAELVFDFTSAAFIAESLTANDEKVKNDDGKLIVNDIKPGETIKFATDIDWKVIKVDYPRSIASRLLVTAVSGQERVQKEIALDDVRIESELEVEAAAYFHSPQGDQLGIGPVPPIVGVPTTYWLMIKANNNGNRLENLTLSVHLPRGVELSDDMSLLAGKYSYNKDTRRLLWQVDSLDANSGDYAANFGLTLTPEVSQVGKDARLAEKINYYADDVWTGTAISGTIGDIDTSLPADRFNRGEGRVQAE